MTTCKYGLPLADIQIFVAMAAEFDGVTVKDYYEILFPYAYNFLGVYADAEDAVQEVLFKYLAHRREGIDNIKGYLVRSVINQSIEIKNKRKRVGYKDAVLFETVATEEADTSINLSENASYALGILLKRLNARERAVFILKEGFDYSHREIADLLLCTNEQSRQLLSRGKSKLSTKRKLKVNSSDSLDSGVLNKYVHLIRSRDTKALEKLLSEGVPPRRQCNRTGFKNPCSDFL